MKTSIIVGTFAFVLAAGGVAACDSKGSGNKVENKAPIVRTPEATPVAIHDTVGKVEAPAPAPAESATTPSGVRFSLVLAEGKTGFRVNSMMLSEEAKAKIDEMFTGGKVDLKDAHFEIEGYTDNLGPKDLNEKIGRVRAEAVKQYLVERYEVSPETIKVISFGLDKPVADNATPEGRAQNRRVVIKVLD